MQYGFVHPGGQARLGQSDAEASLPPRETRCARRAKGALPWGNTGQTCHCSCSG